MTAGSDAVTVNGKKISLGQKVKRNGDDILAPLTAFSKKVLGLYTFTDGEGLLITAKTPISLDMSEHKKEYQINGVVDPKLNIVKELNHYMEFPRPTAAEIRKKYETDGERGHPECLQPREILKGFAAKETRILIPAICAIISLQRQTR